MSARRLRLCLAIAAAGLLAVARPARAHDESLSASQLVVEGRQLRWRLDVGLAGLAKVIPFGGAPAGGELGVVDEAEIATRKDAIADYLQRGLQVSLDGRPVRPAIGALTPLRESLQPGAPARITRVALALTFEGDRDISRIDARIGLFSNLTSLHRAVLEVRWGDETTQLARLGVSEVVLERGRLNPSRWVTGLDFLRWGAHHIFVGYDHIAFLLALLLAVGRLRPLFVIITSFTVAHSLTILLAALDIVSMPVRVTEALIAASIVWVALENIVLGARPRPRRWALTFAFGLVHGLGFAEVLADRLSEAPGGVLLPVIAFNLGVEVGQAVLVAVAFPLLIWLRRGASGLLPPEARGNAGGSAAGVPSREVWNPLRVPDQSSRTRQERILRLGSIPIALLGLVWLVQRLM